jgi:hypothetical protein
METVTRAVEQACAREKGAPLEQMADALVEGFFLAKLKSVETSRALYYVSDDVGGAEIVRQLGARGVHAVAAMLKSSGAEFTENTEVMAATVMAAMSGVSRRMLEAPTSAVAAMRDGLLVMTRAYLNACVVDRALPGLRLSVR